MNHCCLFPSFNSPNIYILVYVHELLIVCTTHMAMVDLFRILNHCCSFVQIWRIPNFWTRWMLWCISMIHCCSLSPFVLFNIYSLVYVHDLLIVRTIQMAIQDFFSNLEVLLEHRLRLQDSKWIGLRIEPDRRNWIYSYKCRSGFVSY